MAATLSANLLAEQVYEKVDLVPQMDGSPLEVARLTRDSIINIRQYLGVAAVTPNLDGSHIFIPEIPSDRSDSPDNSTFRANFIDGVLFVDPDHPHSIMRYTSDNPNGLWIDLSPEDYWTYSQSGTSGQEIVDSGIDFSKTAFVWMGETGIMTDAAEERAHRLLVAANTVIMTAQNLGES